MTIERTALADIRAELAGVLAHLDRLLAPPASAPDLTAMDLTKAIEWVLKDKGERMKPVQIWQVLHDTGRSEQKYGVQVTTNRLAHDGRIMQLGDGWYLSKGSQ